MKYIKTQKLIKDGDIIKNSRLVNCEYIKEIYISQRNNSRTYLYKICYEDDNILGRYSSKEMAITVYEMICRFLDNKEETLFIMPQDPKQLLDATTVKE